MADHDREDFPTLVKARSLWKSGATDAALDCFRTAVTERPSNIKALLEAARAFGGRFEIEAAEGLLARAERLAGHDPRVAVQVAVSYGRMFRETEAITRLEMLAPRSPAAMAELAALYEHAGRLDEAYCELEACRAAVPESAEPALAMARVLRRQGACDPALRILNHLVLNRAAPPLLAEAWTELCYIHDTRGDADAAVHAIGKAHAVLRGLPQTSQLIRQARRNNEAINQLARGFTTAHLRKWTTQATAPKDGPTRLAHLVGFPRSGTTLLEQVLDAHGGVIASPERVIFTRDILPRLCVSGGGALTLDTLNRVPASDCARLKNLYLRYVQAALGEPIASRLHLDKNPNHTGLLPALLRISPDARIIFALRDPRDVVTSCVLRTFRLTEFSAMLLDWGTAAELYAAEMVAWLRYRENLDPEQWIQTRYEDMVADPMRELRRILPRLGLDWDQSIVHYRDKLDGKTVHSPTQSEVRRPIHRRSVDRWRAYRRHLEPHISVLDPFIDAFGYR